MDGIETFAGFPKESLGFFGELKENNYREWFKERKDDYQEYVLKPAQAFVVALGERLTAISDGITFDTLTNGRGSILRIYRDIRFIKDKSPYHTKLRIRFSEGSGEKKGYPGLFFGMDETGGRLLGGLYTVPKSLLEKYRQAVVDEQAGTILTKAIDEINNLSGYEIGGKHYKRVPRGYDASHPRANLLQFNTLYVRSPEIPASVLQKPDLVEVCFDSTLKMAPIHHWLVQVSQ
ncbi:MAG: DUF2461 domain-containing protein [Candidatus Thorarchaeota archaeon]|jgi:uncharacterized protein (TIGR02453 family)